MTVLVGVDSGVRTKVQPGGYNRIDGDMVYTQCQCGWKTRKRKPGQKPPKKVFVTPFHCPKCNMVLSETTVER